MATLHVQVSPKDLLDAVENMEQEEFSTFFEEVLRMRARRTAPALTASEEDLIRKIYDLKMSEPDHERLILLGDKLEAETATTEERKELKRLSKKSEKMTAKRLHLVGQLAILRQQPLKRVMKELGLRNPYAG